MAPPDETEKRYRRLWRCFYDTIAIRERENPKLRMSHMPKRFWPLLPERERMTILLRFFKGLTQEQAARLLGVSQVQVSRLERRALEKLRASLSDGL